MTVATKENSEKGAEITFSGAAVPGERGVRMSGDLDMETLTIEYDDCVKKRSIKMGELESETEIYRNGKGRLSSRAAWLPEFDVEDDEEHIADGFVFEYNSYDGEESGGVGMANPWRDVTEEEAASVVTHLFRVPEGAENVMWSMMDAGEAQEAEGEEVSPLVQLFFELDGTQFTARAKQGGDPEDISGHDWDATETL